MSPDKIRFALTEDDLHGVEEIAALLRTALPTLEAEGVRKTGELIGALERLPSPTPGLNMVVTWSQARGDGNYGWVDLSLNDDEFQLGAGEHFYDPAIGGDTESRTVFFARIARGTRRGDIHEWLKLVEGIPGLQDLRLEDLTE